MSEGGADAGQVVSLHLPVRMINMNKSPKSGTDERYQPPRQMQGATQSRKNQQTRSNPQLPAAVPSTSNSRDFHLTWRGKEARRVRDGHKVTIITSFYFILVPLSSCHLPSVSSRQAFDSPASGWEDMTERRLCFPAKSQHKTFPRRSVYWWFQTFLCKYEYNIIHISHLVNEPSIECDNGIIVDHSDNPYLKVWE